MPLKVVPRRDRKLHRHLSARLGRAEGFGLSAPNPWPARTGRSASARPLTPKAPKASFFKHFPSLMTGRTS